MQPTVAIARSAVAAMSSAEFAVFLREHKNLAAANRALGLDGRNTRVLYSRMEAEGLRREDVWPNARERWNGVIVHPLNLLDEAQAYYYGLALADGTIRGRRGDPFLSGAVSIELSGRDQPIFDALDASLPWRFRQSTRTRPSPFDGALSTTVEFVCHDIDLRSQLLAHGFPCGRKSDICSPPSREFHAKAFWRGFVDGDGSLGISAQGLPFISLVTRSDAILAGFSDVMEEVSGYRPTLRRNKRDQVYNIMLTRSRAVTLIAWLYGAATLALPRKMCRAQDIMMQAAPTASNALEAARTIMAGELEQFWKKPKGKANG